VLLDLRAVPVIDATGLVNLESAVERLQEAGIFAVLGGLRRQPRDVMERAGWGERPGRLALCGTYDEALALARRRVAEIDGTTSGPEANGRADDAAPAAGVRP